MFFYRRASLDTFNGDDSNYDECEDDDFEELLCSDEGEREPVVNQFGEFIAIDDDEEELNGTNNTSQRLSNEARCRRRSRRRWRGVRTTSWPA